MKKEDLTMFIKSEAERLGFDICGIAKAETVSEETIQKYNGWIGQGKHATMGYLERNCGKRFDPTQLVEGCRSVICVALSYAPEHSIDRKSVV